MARSIKKGSIDQSQHFILLDSTTGLPATGVTLTDIDLSYARTREAHVKQDASALGAANAAHTDWGAFEVHATERPGEYRGDFPDAAFATGNDAVHLMMTAPGCAPAYKEIVLTDADASDLADIEAALTGPVDANLVQVAGTADGVQEFSDAIRAIVIGVVGVGSTTTEIVLSNISIPPGHTGSLSGKVLMFRGDTTTAALRAQGTRVLSSTTGATPTLTVDALTTAPVSGDLFTIE